MTFLLGFLLGLIFGVIFLALAELEKVKTHDLTIFMGRPKWINRSDKINMTYDELKAKYGKV